MGGASSRIIVGVYSNCLEWYNSCCFQRFPFHPHCHMRKPCETLLLRSVELANGHLHLYPFLTYCYLSLEVSLQSLLLRPTFFEACEQWRTRKTTEDERMSTMEMFGASYNDFNGYPFLSKAGNLAFILNVDFFQPYKHVQYSLGAIYLCVMNLPREIRYKRENVILVGLIPGPSEPCHDMNSFLKPLVDDLMKCWQGVDMNIASLNHKKKIHCALLCVACDLPAGRKVCGFLGHSTRLRCSRCYKKFTGSVGLMDYRI